MGRLHFADRLAALVEERRSRVVLGLDPDPAALWPVALEGEGTAARGGPAAERGGPVAERGEPVGERGGPVGERGGPAAVSAARAVARHCAAAIDAAGPACVAVKLQLACFERLGAPGWAALEAVRDDARVAGLLVIADAKRGDVPVTAKAYAQALVGSTPTPFGPVGGFAADALTANPLLGRDSLDPLIDAARAGGAGVFVLVNTSNPGASDLQDLDTQGAPLYERLAQMVDAAGQGHVGDCGLSLVGAVTGATRPERLARLRGLMPRAIFLLPGVGAQGGAPAALAPAFTPHPAAGLVTASRSIVDAHQVRGGEPAAAAAGSAQELRALTWNQ